MAPFKQARVPAHLKPENYVFGRPTEYRPEYCQLVIEFMSKGNSLTAFAGHILVGRETVYGWIRSRPDFSDACARARSARVAWLERKLLRSRKGAVTSAAIFALKNAAPDEWRDVKQTEHYHTLKYDDLTDDQLRAIAAGADPVEVTGAQVIEGEYQVLHDKNGKADSGSS